HLIDTVAWNEIPIKRGAGLGIDYHRVSLAKQVAEIAGAHALRWNCSGIGAGDAYLGALVVGEEENFVLAVEESRHEYGSSGCESVLVALEWGLGPGRIEEVLRIQLLISQEFERSAMQLVAARLGGHVDHAAHCASVLGGERIS